MGGVIDNNLFLGFDSPWCIPRGIYLADGRFGKEGENRVLYFFNVKPNTTYRYTAKTPGDRMYIFALSNSHDTPPVPGEEQLPYGETVRVIKNTYTDSQLLDYTFTTDPNDRMVYMCIAREVKPTGVRIVEVES